MVSHSSRGCVGDLANFYMGPHMQHKFNSQLKREQHCRSSMDESPAMSASEWLKFNWRSVTAYTSQFPRSVEQLRQYPVWGKARLRCLGFREMKRGSGHRSYSICPPGGSDGGKSRVPFLSQQYQRLVRGRERGSWGGDLSLYFVSFRTSRQACICRWALYISPSSLLQKGDVGTPPSQRSVWNGGCWCMELPLASCRNQWQMHLAVWPLIRRCSWLTPCRIWLFLHRPHGGWRSHITLSA